MYRAAIAKLSLQPRHVCILTPCHVIKFIAQYNIAFDHAHAHTHTTSGCFAIPTSSHSSLELPSGALSTVSLRSASYGIPEGPQSVYAIMVRKDIESEERIVYCINRMLPIAFTQWQNLATS